MRIETFSGPRFKTHSTLTRFIGFYTFVCFTIVREFFVFSSIAGNIARRHLSFYSYNSYINRLLGIDYSTSVWDIKKSPRNDNSGDTIWFGFVYLAYKNGRVRRMKLIITFFISCFPYNKRNNQAYCFYGPNKNHKKNIYYSFV